MLTIKAIPTSTRSVALKRRSFQRSDGSSSTWTSWKQRTPRSTPPKAKS